MSKAQIVGWAHSPFGKSPLEKYRATTDGFSRDAGQ